MSAENATVSSSWFGIPGTIDVFGIPVELLTILLTIVIIVAGFVIAHSVRIVTTRYLGSHLPPDTRKTIGRISYYVIIAIALFSALGVSGIDLSGVFLAGGIAGIVIGFATQSLFSNLISGIFLQVDKPMKIGDPVLITGKLPDVAGIVVEITTLSSRLRMFDGTYVRLPNSDVFLSEIRNFSGAAARRVEISVRIAYREDTTKVVEMIRKSLRETPLVLIEPEPDIYVDSLGDSAVNINVWCWVPFSVWFNMRKQLVEQVKKELDANRIEIPLPQRIVYLADRSHSRKGGSSLGVSSGEIHEGLNIDEYMHQND
ncbi:mechanosensitive ion channel family protein [Candidatus Nitrososphaera gargensis]|uniref:mechanosensitive ion channel family protein n=1 Tax=Candidatus Nitrososphaera gargensis TaxID=497727 RepID=UPI00164F5C33|nr:mechanosensitive ion channel family protein [Candidatus Nitrososphaera gargensis]